MPAAMWALQRIRDLLPVDEDVAVRVALVLRVSILIHVRFDVIDARDPDVRHVSRSL
jgi:hypothetical protein